MTRFNIRNKGEIKIDQSQTSGGDINNVGRDGHAGTPPGSAWIARGAFLTAVATLAGAIGAFLSCGPTPESTPANRPGVEQHTKPRRDVLQERFGAEKIDNETGAGIQYGR